MNPQQVRNGESAPAPVLPDQPARSETAPGETAQANSTPLPDSITNDVRWRAVWRRLLMPVEAGEAVSDEAD